MNGHRRTRVWIITTASLDEVRTWLGERFSPDEIYGDWTDHIRREHCPVPNGMKPYCPVPNGMKPLGVWWD